MRITRPLSLVVSLVLGAVLAGCEGQASAPAPMAPEVTVSTPLVKEVVDWDDYIGQFEAIEDVVVRPRVTGYLVGVHFEEGQLVNEGDLLFTIDARPFEAALDQARSRVRGAEARVENARTQLERAKSLVEIQAVSTEEFEGLQAALRSAESELEAARAVERAAALDVDFTRITAPISGRISERRVDAGNAVKADDTVLTRLVSVDPIHFSFQGSEALYLKYKRNGARFGEGKTPVRIRLQDESGYSWKGSLDFMDNAIDAGTGTIRGRALVANPDGFLTPGMFGQMQLQASAPYQGILLPDSAIATRGAQRIVFVVDAEGVVGVKAVEPGTLHQGLRVIRSGLEASDRVVISGQQRAFPGQRVQALPGTIVAEPGGGASSAAE